MNLARIYARNEAMGNKPGVMSVEKEIEMMTEEYNEYKKALEAGDKIEVIDGLLDMVFVCGGTLYKVGIPIGDVVLIDGYPDGIDGFIIDYTYSVSNALSILPVIYRDFVCGVYKELHFLFGLSEEQVNLLFEEICRSNDTKEPQEHNGLTKIRKGPNYSPPDLQGVLDSFSS